MGVGFRLLLLLLAVCWGLEAAAAGADGAPQSTAVVGTAAQLLAALEDANIATIAVVKPISMPHGRFKPAVVDRQLLVTSPHREMIDWCNEQCRNGNMTRTPFIILGKGAMVTFNRLFFRNFIPHSSKALTAAALDFNHSPVPFIVSKDGGQAVYNLVVLHWTRPMVWAFKQPGSFWQQAAEEKVRSVGDPQPLQLQTPALYSVKSFSTDAGTAAIADCFMPVDLDGCLSQQPFGTALIYCPYTFKDSLRNPNVDTVLVFHDIGLDRLVNSYRNPAVVNRSVLYRSCPNTRHAMDLDNITNSVLVDSGGSLVLQNLILQGSKSQNKTDWPSSIPLLLSTFRPVGSGSVILRDSTVRVQSMDELIKAMSTLPNGAIHAVESPDLRPTYADGKPPRLGDASFTIRLWQLQRQRWLLSKTGGSTIMDKLGSTASWQFFNVTAEKYTEPDCFAAAVVQGSILPGRYSKVSTGQELLDQLGNSSARYIRVMSDITLPPDLGMRRITVSRIVEIRSCTDGPAHVIDWADNHDSVIVSGNAIWQGNMALKGIGWSEESVLKKEIQIVDALHPTGTGILEYEDLTLMADMPSIGWEPDAGKTSVAGLLGVSDLESSPLNMSMLGPGKLLLRGFYLNQSLPSGGTDGMESFQDVTLSWSPDQEGGSGGRGLSQGGLLAAIIIPIIVASVLAGTLLACLFCRAYHRRRAASAAGGKDVDDFGTRSPFVNAIAHVCMGGGKGSGKGGGGAGPVVVGDGTASSGFSEHSESSVRGRLDQQASCTSGPSGTSARSSVSRSRDRTAFNADIAQACKVLVTRRGVGRDDELILESVLGEGSYGKVFKATWRGTVVAVKIMVLPAHLSGKEKREKMAVMETAISSSLSHPNCVQTYTYAVEPVRANSSMTDHSGDEGPSMHDSTCSWKGASSGAGLARLAKEQFRDGSGSDMGTFSWEVRLVQEYCDLGSLRSAFKQNYFKSACGAVQPMPLVATAIDVARAMAHLHKHNIVHSDLKARNVLLRSDMQDPRGFTAKVADFGLSITIDPNSTHVSNAFQETLMHGHVSPASDVFAYGILMWELYTGEHAYKGVPRALLGHNITKQGMRPVFPPDTPFEWQFLACRCWESDPGIRPSFHQILEELQRIQARWIASRSSTDESVAATSATQFSSSSYMCSDSSPQLLHRPALPLQQQQQQQGGYLPSIEDTSGPLPSSCAPQQQQQQEWQQPAAGLDQQLHNGGPPAPCLAEQLNAPADAQAGAGAAAGGSPGLGVAALGPQGAAANSMPPPPQKQQQKSGLASPAVHMCFEGSSKDVLVLLSDCDTTHDSIRRY